MATVLLVDDNAMVRGLIEAFLRGIGSTTVSCATVKEAVGVVAQRKFDAVLVDGLMPGEDTDAFVRNLPRDWQVWRITNAPEFFNGKGADVVRNGVLDKGKPDAWMTTLEKSLAT